MSLEPAKQALREKSYSNEHIELASNVTRTQFLHHKQRQKYIEFLADVINTYEETNPVLPVGPLQPLVMVVGDFTGQEEQNIGMPFVGAAGHLLTIILNALGIDRNALYLTNVIKTYKESPTSPDFEEGIELLHKEIEIVKPKYVLSLGEASLRALTKNPKMVLKEKRGAFMNGATLSLFPTHHPQELLNIPNENQKGIQAGKKMIFEQMKFFFNEVKTNHPDWEHNFVLKEYVAQQPQKA